MNTTRKYTAILTIICIILVNLINPFNFTSKQILGHNGKNSNEYSIKTSSSDKYVLDKVFTFTKGVSTITKEYDLEKGYYYGITIEIVTPHEGQMSISITDPERNFIPIFDGKISYTPEKYRKYYIEHGIANSGNHTFRFTVKTLQNLNIYIGIAKERMIQPPSSETPPPGPIPDLYIETFHNENTTTFYAYLDTDWSYKIYVERISRHAINESGETRIALAIYDPYSLEFEIYYNETILKPYESASFNFGTAVEGTYSIKLYVYYESRTVNLAFGIIKQHEIGHVAEPVNSSITNGTSTRIRDANLPKYETFITGIVLLSFICSGLVIYYTANKRRNFPLVTS